MYCTNCGKLADIGDKFCTNCGTKLLEKIGEELNQNLNERNWKFTGAPNSMIIKHHLYYFKDAILKDQSLESEKIIQKYHKEGFCDNSGKITQKGLVVAISYLSLEEQCEALGIELENESININGKAETSALDYYIRQGYRGCYSEGMIIGVILYCLCCKKLYPLDLFKVNKSIGYSKGFISFSEYSDAYRFELISLIKNADEKIVKKNFKKILKKQYYYFRKLWESQGVNEELVIKVYNMLGNEEFANIGELYFKNPFVYQKGWPDLTIIMDNKIRFIEVKTKDKLRRSQIVTISDFKKSTNLEFSVLKIV